MIAALLAVLFTVHAQVGHCDYGERCASNIGAYYCNPGVCATSIPKRTTANCFFVNVYEERILGGELTAGGRDLIFAPQFVVIDGTVVEVGVWYNPSPAPVGVGQGSLIGTVSCP